MRTPIQCPACGSGGTNRFCRIPNLPVFCNVLYGAREEAVRCPRGNIDLAFCPECAYVFNAEFDEALVAYDGAYENALHFSPRFAAYADGLARQLIETYDLRGKTILEIGCGDGSFLRSLCRMGKNRGIGFDPAYVDRGEIGPEEGIEFVRDCYTETSGDFGADFICCRHVLEHIPNPLELLLAVGTNFNGRSGVFFYLEAPNGEEMLGGRMLWDIIYEHCGYYTGESLACLLRRAGFEVLCVRRQYEDQFLGVEATLRPESARAGDKVDVAGVEETIGRLAGSYRRKVVDWSERLKVLESQGRKVVIWGGGSKGVTFLNVCGGQVERVVDINPRKQGMYIPGSGQQVVSAEFLQEHPPDCVIVMNPIYHREIKELLAEYGLKVEIMNAT